MSKWHPLKVTVCHSLVSSTHGWRGSLHIHVSLSVPKLQVQVKTMSLLPPFIYSMIDLVLSLLMAVLHSNFVRLRTHHRSRRKLDLGT